MGKDRNPKPLLTAQHVRFAQLLFNRATTPGKTIPECYLEAGFPAKENPHATEMAAQRCVRNREFIRYYREIQDNATNSAQVTIDYLVRGFKAAVDADVSRLMGPDGEVLPPAQWPADMRRCITRIEVEELSEMQPDPSRPGKKKKVAIGTKWKVWLENKTECRKVLAQWKRMIGQDVEVAKPPERGNSIVVELGPDQVEPPAEGAA